MRAIKAVALCAVALWRLRISGTVYEEGRGWFPD